MVNNIINRISLNDNNIKLAIKNLKPNNNMPKFDIEILWKFAIFLAFFLIFVKVE